VGLGWRDSGGGTRVAGLGWRDSGGGTGVAGLGWRDSGGGTRVAGLGWRDSVAYKTGPMDTPKVAVPRNNPAGTLCTCAQIASKGSS